MLAQQLSVRRRVTAVLQQQFAILALPHSLLADTTQSSESDWQLKLPHVSSAGSPVAYQIKSKQIRTGSEAGELQMKECAIGGRDLGSCEQECQRNQALQKRVMWQTWYLLAKLTAYKPGFCGLRGSIRSL